MVVWNFAYSDRVPLPAPGDRTISVYGDGVVAAVCHRLGLADLSGGRPPPKYVPPGAALHDRVVALDRWVRSDLTADVWSATCDWAHPGPDLLPTATYRRARALARPGPRGLPPATEVQALGLLREVLDHPSGPAALRTSADALDARLLATDIAARHGLADEAREHLRQWYDLAVTKPGTLAAEAAFGLIGVASLLCEGALRTRSGLTGLARPRLVRTLLAGLTDRLSRPEPSKPPQWRHRLFVSHSQFYLEPLQADLEAVPFQAVGESEQGFSSFPGQVAFATPSHAGDCVVEARFGSRLPPLRHTVQAVAVPLTVVEPGGLYLRTVTDGGDKQRLDVPAGHYDVVARFFPARRRQRESTYLTSWRCVLTFLPGGTVGPKCLRTEYGPIPAELVLHGRGRH
jgi:hypothetical protein